MKRPKTPEPTAQEKAVVERQSRMLDEEMEESEKRLKALARGKLGSKSLLAKAGVQVDNQVLHEDLLGLGLEFLEEVAEEALGYNLVQDILQLTLPQERLDK